MRLGPMLEATLIVRELNRSLPGYLAHFKAKLRIVHEFDYL